VDLEGGDAGKRSRWSADLSREVGKGDEVVPDQRRDGRETIACQLDPVARIARKSDDDPLFLLYKRL
jgi:hypothetical protein